MDVIIDYKAFDTSNTIIICKCLIKKECRDGSRDI